MLPAGLMTDLDRARFPEQDLWDRSRVRAMARPARLRPSTPPSRPAATRSRRKR